MEENCIFCKIVKKELPCFKVYEDDLVLAFLNINPVTLGHTLLIPKKHFENIFDIDENILERIAEVSKKIALKMESIDAEGVTVFQSNGKIAEQEIMHYHMHLIPRRKSDTFKINSVLKPLVLNEDQFKNILEKIKI